MCARTFIMAAVISVIRVSFVSAGDACPFVWSDEFGRPERPTAGINDLLVYDADGPGPDLPYLYVAGLEEIVPGSGSSVARWDGESWESLGAGAGATTPVRSLAIHDVDGPGPAAPELYAGRESGVVRWDGAAWQSIGSTNSLLLNIKSVDLDGAGPQPPLLVAAGFFTSIGGVPANRVAVWDGSLWMPLEGGVNGLAWGIEVFDEDAGGAGSPKLFVTGNFSSAGGNPAVGIASWDGQSWSAVGTGLDDSAFALLAVDEDGDGPGAEKLFVGGEFTMAGGAAADRVACWDGSSWSAVGSGTLGMFPGEFLFADPDGPGPGDSMLMVVGSDGSNNNSI